MFFQCGFRLDLFSEDSFGDTSCTGASSSLVLGSLFFDLTNNLMVDLSYKVRCLLL